MISLAEQIACVRREIALRERVYPRQVRAGKLRQDAADLEPPPRDMRARENEAAQMRSERYTLDAIGQRFGVSSARARQMLQQYDRRVQAEARNAQSLRRLRELTFGMIPSAVPLGRPLDMGGPRDEWIERDPWSAQ